MRFLDSFFFSFTIISLFLLLLHPPLTVSAEVVIRIPEIGPGSVHTLDSSATLTGATTIYEIVGISDDATLFVSGLNAGVDSPVLFNVTSAGNFARIIFRAVSLRGGLYVVAKPRRASDVVSLDIVGSEITCEHIENSRPCNAVAATYSAARLTRFFPTALRLEVDVASLPADAAAARGFVNVTIQSTTVALDGPEQRIDGVNDDLRGRTMAAALVTPARNSVPGDRLPLSNITVGGGSKFVVDTAFSDCAAYALTVGSGQPAMETVGEYITVKWWEEHYIASRMPFGDTTLGDRQRLFQMMPLGALAVSDSNLTVRVTSSRAVALAVSRVRFDSAGGMLLLLLLESSVFSAEVTVDKVYGAGMINASMSRTVVLVDLDGGGRDLSDDWWRQQQQQQGAGGSIIMRDCKLFARVVMGIRNEPNSPLLMKLFHARGIGTTGVHINAVDYFHRIEFRDSTINCPIFLGESTGVRVALARFIVEFEMRGVLSLQEDPIHGFGLLNGGTGASALFLQRLAYCPSVRLHRVTKVHKQKHLEWSRDPDAAWCQRRTSIGDIYCGSVLLSRITCRYCGSILIDENEVSLLYHGRAIALSFVNCSHVRKIVIANHTSALTSSPSGVSFVNLEASTMINISSLLIQNCSVVAELGADLEQYGSYGNVAAGFLTANATCYVGEISVRDCAFFVRNAPRMKVDTANGKTDPGAICIFAQTGAVPKIRYLFDNIRFEAACGIMTMAFAIGTPWKSLADANTKGSSMVVRRLVARVDAVMVMMVFLSAAQPRGDGWSSTNIGDVLLKGRTDTVYRGPILYAGGIAFEDSIFRLKRNPMARSSIFFVQDAALVGLRLINNTFVNLPGSGPLSFGNKNSYDAISVPDPRIVALVKTLPKMKGQFIDLVLESPCSTISGSDINGAIVYNDIVRETTGATEAATFPPGSKQLFKELPVEGKVRARNCGRDPSMTHTAEATETYFLHIPPTRTETNRSRATWTRTNSTERTETETKELPGLAPENFAPPSSKQMASVAATMSLLGGAGASVALDSSRALSVMALLGGCNAFYETGRAYSMEERREEFVRQYLLYQPAFPESIFGIGVGPSMLGRYIRGAIVSHILVLLLGALLSLLFGFVMWRRAVLAGEADPKKPLAFLRYSRMPLIVGKLFAFLVAAWTVHALVLSFGAPKSLELPGGDIFFGLLSIGFWIAIPSVLFWIFWRCVDRKPHVWVCEEFLLNFGWREALLDKARRRQWEENEKKEAETAAAADESSSKKSNSKKISGRTKNSSGSKNRSATNLRDVEMEERPSSSSAAAAAPASSSSSRHILQQQNKDRKKAEKALKQTCKWKTYAVLEDLVRGKIGKFFVLGDFVHTEFYEDGRKPRQQVAMGVPGRGWMHAVGGLLNKQAAPFVVERETQPLTAEERRKERSMGLEYERDNLGGLLTRRYYYVHRHQAPEKWWQRLPLLKVTPFYYFISLFWTFVNAVAQAVATADPSKCESMLVFLAVINCIALVLDGCLRPFLAAFRNLASFCSALFIAFGSILAAAAVQKAANANAAAARGADGAHLAAESSNEALVVAASVGIYAALAAGLLITLVNLGSKVVLFVLGLGVLLRRDVVEQAQRVTLTVDSLIGDGFGSSGGGVNDGGVQELISLRMRQQRVETRAAAQGAKLKTGGVEVGGMGMLSQAFL